MPATESTWRDIGKLHRIFAISGVVLTISTVWMFYKDHARPWKSIQPNVVNIDLKMNDWRREQFETTTAVLEHERLSRDLSIAKAQPLDPDLLAEFKRELEDQPGSRKADWIDEGAKDLAPLAQDAANKRAEAVAAHKALDAKPADKDLHVAAVKAEEAALKAERAAAAERERLLTKMRTVVNDAKIREDKALGTRKFKSADIDAAKANLDIAIRDHLGAQEVARRQKIVDDLVAGPGGLNELTERYQTLSAHRKKLDGIVKKLTAQADEAQKDYTDALADLERLKTQYQQQEETWFSSSFPFLGKKWTTVPILDAFNSTRKIDNLWSEDLEHEYGSFGSVRRFDRCTTCHQSLAKSVPGSPTDPAYVKQRTINLVLNPPPKESPPQPRLNAQGEPLPLTTEDWLGIRLADAGLLATDDVTVSLVLPGSPAARAALLPQTAVDNKAQPGRELREEVANYTGEKGESNDLFPVEPGLLVGDVITGINGSPLQGGGLRAPRRIGADLVTLAQDGKPIELQVRRGLPNPYISHPRLDLYVSDSSPHRLQTFACTVCHDGQGSATEFKFASHTPNTQIQAEQWIEEYGWFDNHHWIFPMNPKRFAESSCLKCHHEVVELEASEKYPEAPAPKVAHGYQLIRKYGCFGCHEINGFDGPVKRVGPDLRAEPSYFASAQALLPLLPARAGHFQQLLAQTEEQIAPVQQQLETVASDKAKLNEQKSQIPADAADKDTQTKALDEQIAPLTAQEQSLQKQLAGLQNQVAAARRHAEAVSRVARLATDLAARPELDALRHELYGLLDDDARIATENKDKPLAQQEWTTFDAKIHAMAGWFKDQEAPGDERKPGPSLRYLAAKLDREFLYDWLHDPTHFRQSTRMPKFFGLWDHLKNAKGEMADPHAPELEPIEIRGMIEYLMAQSNAQWPASASAAQPANVEQLVQIYEPLPREAGIDPWTDEEKVARGKIQFQTRGCLACHTHQDFPEVNEFRNPDEIVQGPDLSGVGSKFSAERNPRGPDWLYSWIKEPTRYHTRTVMPNLFLGPEKDQGADPVGTDDDKWFDPADDIAAYLLTSKSDWQPVPAAKSAGEPLDEAGRIALEKLALEYLNEAFYKDAAATYFDNGISPELEDTLKGAEKDMITPPGQKPTENQKLHYIGRKTIAKYGCFGCHDIPGFEDAKPIGTGLADWGRKDPARLAFEHITHYTGGHGHRHAGEVATHREGHDEPEKNTHEAQAAARADMADSPGGTAAQETRDYYAHALAAGNRIGFIEQKLKEPRSYDFEKTENKRYNERLRMPQFPFTMDEREAIITFVLGLVADPPREKYVYTPAPREQALIAGRQVLEKYNCGGCHILGLEKWQISYSPGTYGMQNPPDQPAVVTYPFLVPQFAPSQLRAQARPDHRGLLHSELVGLPKIDPRDGLPQVFDPDNTGLTDDDEYQPSELRLSMDLFQPAIIDGDAYMTGVSPLRMPIDQIASRQPAWGGVLARYLVPHVTRLEKQANPNASGAEAYAWLPPPLIGEGDKVQAAWLHDFLLEPYPIRPATFLRMPKFNMTSGEATALVNYFAAVDNADYPYQISPQRLDSQLAAKAKEYAQEIEKAGASPAGGEGASGTAIDDLIQRRFEDAMKIVVDGNYCVKCHKVADYDPPARDRGKAPQLSDVYRRMRPDYLRRWIAKPSTILPYTSMPENIKYEPQKPFEGGVSQDLYHGTSTEQVDALVDLLMNYDTYARRGHKIADMVKPAPMPAEGAPPAEGTTPPAEGAAAPATGNSGE